MASIASLQGLKFDNTLGAMLVGVLVSTTLFGLTTLQTYLYYVNYAKDRAAFKWLQTPPPWLNNSPLVKRVLDLTHTIFIAHTAYYFLVLQYGNPASLLDGEWSLIMEVAITVLVTVLVQWWVADSTLASPSHQGKYSFTLVSLRIVYTSIKLFSRLPEVLGVMSATLIIMAVNDLFITIVLCWYLHKAQSAFNETQSAIRLLIVYTIETGLVTSIFVTVDAVCILTMPHNWIFIGITVCISKLYANSLLTILNSRHSLKIRDSGSNKLSGVGGRQSAIFTSVRMQELSSVSKTQELSPMSPLAKTEPDFGVSSPATRVAYAV
ncbi:hypothetical protein JB92DRAFT_3111420 [Gautieria morchelliformis]|nr:hypothetical protein JB92DRAFT_3111420 [Gautieria morchelliformis]